MAYEYEFHEVANLFPMMDPESFEALKKDIVTNGLLEPIWLHDKKIIDGRNRYLACQETGFAPAFREWSGEGSLVSFIVGCNIERLKRVLNKTQLACYAVHLAPFYEAEIQAQKKLAGKTPLKSQKPTKESTQMEPIANVFNYGGSTIRSVTQNGEPWFFAQDVTDILGFAKNTVNITKRHCLNATLLKFHPEASLNIPKRGLTIIPKSDVDRLVLRSKLDTASAFKEFVDKRFPSTALPVCTTGGLTIFNFSGMDVRTVQQNGEPWFVAKDVCDVLDIINSRDSLSKLDDDEKGVVSTDTLGGFQSMSAVNESGLYSLILTSRKPVAKTFKKFITATVMPEIRKTGNYIGMPHRLPQNYTEAVERLLGELKTNAILIEDKTRLEQTVAVQQPKVDVYDAITTSDYHFLVREAAKFVGTTQNTLMMKMRNNGMLMCARGRRNEPYQQFLNNGILDYKISRDAKGNVRPNRTPVFTGKGMLWLVQNPG